MTRRRRGWSARLRGMVRRLGEPVIRTAVSRAMREMGRQFVLGQDIGEAMARAGEDGGARLHLFLRHAGRGGAHDGATPRRYYADAYARRHRRDLPRRCTEAEIAANPGISVKLSALHPRYEVAQDATGHGGAGAACSRSSPRQAAAAGMGLNIDAEEADRLGAVARRDRGGARRSRAGRLGRIRRGGAGLRAARAADVIDWLTALAERFDRRIMVRLVKGAYWDTEIKHAQVEGLDDFPVFTRKTRDRT